MSWPENRLLEIARRKEHLLARAAAQRAAIAGAFHELRGPAAIVDHGVEVMRFVRAHPMLVTLAIGAMAAVGPRWMFALAGRGVAAWRIWTLVAAWLGGRRA